MKRLMAWSVLLIGFGTGCATTPPRSTVHAYPVGGHGGGHGSRDVAHCETWAKQQTGYDPVSETVTGVAVGTLLGGALGAGTGAAVGAASGGSVGRGAATGAVLGGVVGGVAGGAYKYSQSKEGYDRAYAACMASRPPALAPMPVVVASAPAPVVVRPAPVVVAPPPVVVVAPRRVHVPPGHYPPPGHCRIWYQGRPPGHQPRPFPCHQRVAVPPGAFILYNGVAWDGDYDWRGHARRQPGSVPSVIVEISARR
jgi:hypothetical protein